VVLVGTLLAAGGCSGGGNVRIVPLNRTDFTQREPLVQEVPVREACYWTGENGELNVGLRFHAGSLLGQAFAYDWQMSLVLDGPPAGSARLYNLRNNAVRIVQTAGADHRRSRTWSGIAVVHSPGGGRLKGRFHVTVREQIFTLLSGWQPPPLQAPMMIVIGEFDAVHDEARGRAIREATEAGGLERARPATRPGTISIPVR
jgi:hypothetical protein